MTYKSGVYIFIRKAAAALVLAAVASGCVSSPRFVTRETPPRAATPVRPSAEVRPETVTPDSEHSLLITQGIASYYGNEFNGKMTASGEMYDMFQLTAAHRSLPFGTSLRVTNLDNSESVIVRINDRGPFKMERIIDLSYMAATELQMMGVGTARVQLDVIEWGDDIYKK